MRTSHNCSDHFSFLKEYTSFIFFRKINEVNIYSRFDKAEILLQLVINTNQSINLKGKMYIKNHNGRKGFILQTTILILRAMINITKCKYYF